MQILMYMYNLRVSTMVLFLGTLVGSIMKGYCQTQPKVLPTMEQVNWADKEIGVIIHLDINIFAPDTFDYTKKETLPGANAFNPSKLNTDQWIKSAKGAGAKYAILTAKHGTGFCLWPSKVNAYNVGHTHWRNGQYDVVKHFIVSCKKYGIKPGFYYNTNTNTYYEAPQKTQVSDSATAVFNKAVLAQLTELWSNYGDIFEIWFDGGVMVDEKKGIADKILALIHKKQPHAILFQGPFESHNIIRWTGNEDGVAPYPFWSRADSVTSSNGVQQIANAGGNPKGTLWCPGESDFPNKKNSAWNGGWLWKAGQDSFLLTANELTDKYCSSVGRNTNMLIGMAIDTSGLFPSADSAILASFGKKISGDFGAPLSVAKHVHSKTTELFYTAIGTKASKLVVMEDVRYGENIRKYTLEAWLDGKWKEIAQGEGVGHKRIQIFKPVAAAKFRFVVKEVEGAVNIKQLALY